MIPGGYRLQDEDVLANSGRTAISLKVANTGDRPVQVGSHFHFFESNRALRFERRAAFGMRLNIPAGTAARFEPGDEKVVSLVPIGGEAAIFGLNGLTNGVAAESSCARALEKARHAGFQDTSK